MDEAKMVEKIRIGKMIMKLTKNNMVTINHICIIDLKMLHQ